MFTEQRFKASATTFALAKYTPRIIRENLMYQDIEEPNGDLRQKLEYNVYQIGERPHTVSFSVPDTWLDAFKVHFSNRWWMRAIVRKWPAKMRTLKETVFARALLPDVPVRLAETEVVFVVHKGGMF